MSDLATSLERLDSVLGRMVTMLDSDSLNQNELATLSLCHEEASDDVNRAIHSLKALPAQVKPAVDRICKLDKLVKSMMRDGMEAATAGIQKARISRQALGRNSRADHVALGATGIDCNIGG